LARSSGKLEGNPFLLDIQPDHLKDKDPVPNGSDGFQKNVLSETAGAMRHAWA
jgi:hypothetical protein